MNRRGRLVAILVLGCLGILAPVAVVGGMTLFRSIGNSENQWFREHGEIHSARLIEIGEQRAGKGFEHVALFEVTRSDGGNGASVPARVEAGAEAGGPLGGRRFREVVDGLAWETWTPGQELSVWLAGDRARIVRADHPLRPKLYLLLLIPAMSLLLLGIVVYWNRQSVALPKGGEAKAS